MLRPFRYLFLFTKLKSVIIVPERLGISSYHRERHQIKQRHQNMMASAQRMPIRLLNNLFMRLFYWRIWLGR